MNIPIIDGFENEITAINNGILEKKNSKNNDLYVDTTISLLTDYGRALYKAKKYEEAELVINIALENDSFGFGRNAIKILYDIYIITNRRDKLYELRKWKQFSYIERKVSEKEDEADPKTFLKTISKLKKDSDLYIEAIEDEANRIYSKHYDHSVTLQFEIVKYLISKQIYDRAWGKLNYLSNQFMKEKKYVYLVKVEKLKAKIFEEEERYKDCFLALVIAEIYSKYNGYLFYREAIPRYEELNGHPLLIDPISIEKMKCENIIEKANFKEKVSEIEWIVNKSAEDDKLLYINVIQKVIDILKSN